MKNVVKMTILVKFEDFSKKCNLSWKTSLRPMGSAKKPKFWQLTLMGSTFRHKVPDFQYFYISSIFGEISHLSEIFADLGPKMAEKQFFQKSGSFVLKMHPNSHSDRNYRIPPLKLFRFCQFLVKIVIFRKTLIKIINKKIYLLQFSTNWIKNWCIYDPGIIF